MWPRWWWLPLAARAATVSVVVQYETRGELARFAALLRPQYDGSFQELFVLDNSCRSNVTTGDDLRRALFESVPRGRFRALCAGGQPEAATLAVAARVSTADHLVVLSAARDLPIGPLSADTLLRDGKSLMLRPLCGYDSANLPADVASARDEFADRNSSSQPAEAAAGSEYGLCVQFAPLVVSTVVARALRKTLLRQEDDSSSSSSNDSSSSLKNSSARSFTSGSTFAALYDAFLVLHWGEFFERFHAVSPFEALVLDAPPDASLQFFARSHVARGTAKRSLFLRCPTDDCFEAARALAADNLLGQDDQEKNGEWHGRGAATTKSQAKLDSFYGSLRRDLPEQCPEKLGVALNTGDKGFGLVHEALQNPEDGWIASTLRDESPDLPVVVYSSTQEGCIPVESSCVPVKPCCGGQEDLGATLAGAQSMREHTWAKMLEDFPQDTYWFLSTEEDAWWDVDGLCDHVAAAVAELDVSPETPMLLGAGLARTVYGSLPQVYGSFILVNRPLLTLLANSTLLDGCRDDFLARERRLDTYPDAKYNNDHLLSHCAFEYLPSAGFDVARHVETALWIPNWPRPRYFYQNGGDWSQSLPAEDFVNSRLQPSDPVVAFHHASKADFRFLSERKRQRRRALAAAAGNSTLL